jgi:CBS domain-containing protein
MPSVAGSWSVTRGRRDIMDTKVRDVMTPDPVGVYYEQTIAEAARVMRDSCVGAVLVVKDGALVGVVTDRDLIVRALADGAGPDAPVGPLCSAKLIGVEAGDDLPEAERLMRENAIRRLPVIDQGQIVGMVSIGDLAVFVGPNTALGDVSKAPPNV